MCVEQNAPPDIKSWPLLTRLYVAPSPGPAHSWISTCCLRVQTTVAGVTHPGADRLEHAA